MDKEFVEYIVKALVGNPDDVQIERTIDEKGVLLMLTVNPDDLGRVIGKRGNTAQSIRTLLRALGTKNDARYNLKIVDNGPEKPERAPRPPREERYEDRDNSQSASTAVATDTSGNDSQSPSDGGSRWAHLRSDNDDSTSDDSSSDDDDVDEEEVEEESVVEKTRKELADLDDLDI
ncbi:KH domain-containing protein [Candidatus Saccharibacteria bacterium]|nr:KH domain-containing protein [Candidatus Saccharibacteria bacterium]